MAVAGLSMAKASSTHRTKPSRHRLRNPSGSSPPGKGRAPAAVDPGLIVRISRQLLIILIFKSPKSHSLSRGHSFCASPGYNSSPVCRQRFIGTDKKKFCFGIILFLQFPDSLLAERFIGSGSDIFSRKIALSLSVTYQIDLKHFLSPSRSRRLPVSPGCSLPRSWCRSFLWLPGYFPVKSLDRDHSVSQLIGDQDNLGISFQEPGFQVFQIPVFLLTLSGSTDENDTGRDRKKMSS